MNNHPDAAPRSIWDCKRQQKPDCELPTNSFRSICISRWPRRSLRLQTSLAEAIHDEDHKRRRVTQQDLQYTPGGRSRCQPCCRHARAYPLRVFFASHVCQTSIVAGTGPNIPDSLAHQNRRKAPGFIQISGMCLTVEHRPSSAGSGTWVKLDDVFSRSTILSASLQDAERHLQHIPKRRHQTAPA